MRIKFGRPPRKVAAVKKAAKIKKPVKKKTVQQEKRKASSTDLVTKLEMLRDCIILIDEPLTGRERDDVIQQLNDLVKQCKDHYYVALVPLILNR
jgi:hypothetical protein